MVGTTTTASLMSIQTANAFGSVGADFTLQAVRYLFCACYVGNHVDGNTSDENIKKTIARGFHIADLAK